MAAAGNAQNATVSGEADNSTDAAGNQASPAFNRLRCRSVDAKRDLFRNMRVETSLENAAEQQAAAAATGNGTPVRQAADVHLQVQRNGGDENSTGQRLLKTTSR